MQRVRVRATALVSSHDQGQAVTEYVLLLLGAVLFLVVTASLLRLPVISAVNQISSWTASIQPPTIRGNGNRGGGEDNGNNQGNHNGDNQNGH